MKKQGKTAQPAVSEKRFEIGFHLLNRWLYLRQNGKSLVSFFRDNLVESIAIYGMGALGERLFDEVKDSEISVDYGIDRIADLKGRTDMQIYGTGEDIFPKTEVIVVTPVQDYWAIVELLEAKTDAAIISLEDIIEYCLDGEVG